MAQEDTLQMMTALPSYSDTAQLLAAGEFEYDEAARVHAERTGDPVVAYKDRIRNAFTTLATEAGANSQGLCSMMLALHPQAHPDSEPWLRAGLVQAIDALPAAQKNPQTRVVLRHIRETADFDELTPMLTYYIGADPLLFQRVDVTAKPLPLSRSSEVVAPVVESVAVLTAPVVVPPSEEIPTRRGEGVTKRDAVEMESTDDDMMAGEIEGAARTRKAAVMLKRPSGVTFHVAETMEKLDGYQGVVVDHASGSNVYFLTRLDGAGRRTYSELSKEEAEHHLEHGEAPTWNVANVRRYMPGEATVGGHDVAQPARVAAEDADMTGGEIGVRGTGGAPPVALPATRAVVVLAGLQLDRDEQNNYRRIGTDKIVMTDKGESIKINEGKQDVIKASLALAAEKGWSEITVKGGKRFCSEMWLQASLAGLTVKGYEPNDKDLAALYAVHASSGKMPSVAEKAASHQALVSECLTKQVGTMDVDVNATNVHRGTVMAETAHHFAQHVGKNCYALHEKSPAYPVAVGQSVEVHYKGGFPFIKDVGEKSRSQGLGRG